MSDSLQPHGLHHTRLRCPSPSPGVCWNSCPLSQWCHPTISSSFSFFSCPWSFPASGYFPLSWLFASASVFPMNIQGWLPLRLTGLISLPSKRLSRVLSSTTVCKHQFFGTQPLYGPTLTSVHDYWKKHRFDCMICLHFNKLSRFVIAFLPRSRCLLISGNTKPQVN